MQPSTGNDGRENVTIRRIENGFEVSKSSENKRLSADGNNYLYDYSNVTFAFETIDEAVAKAKELFN